MKLKKPVILLISVYALSNIQNYLEADCPNQDVICCLEHNYPLGGPIAYNQGTCYEWPSCEGIVPACCICSHEQTGLDDACRKANPQYSSDLVTASLSQDCIPPHESKEKRHLPAGAP